MFSKLVTSIPWNTYWEMLSYTEPPWLPTFSMTVKVKWDKKNTTHFAYILESYSNIIYYH